MKTNHSPSVCLGILNLALKFILIPSFLLTGAVVAEEAELITKITERDRDGDGVVDTWMETVRRGNSLVVMTLRNRETNGTISMSRMVKAGEASLTEIDADGDGHCETVALHGGEARNLEVFKRQKDGSLKSVGPAQLALHRQLLALNDDVGKFMRSTSEGKTDAEEAMRQLKQIREKSDALTQQLQELERKEQR